MDLLINIIKRYNMALLIIDLGNDKVECKANFSYIDNHIVLAFQAKDHMLEITGLITDCFNNGDLLEKFTLQFDDENIEVDLKNSSFEKIIGEGNICELWLNRVELLSKGSSTTDCVVLNLSPKQIDGLTEESKQKTIEALESEIVFCYNDEISTYLFCPKNIQNYVVSLISLYCCCPIEILCEFCNDEVNNQTKVKMYSQKHTFEKNSSPINLRTKGDDVAEFIQYAHLNHSHINDMPRYVRQFVDSYYVSEPQRFNMLFAMASSYAEYILGEGNKGGGDLVKCTINHFQVDGLDKIKGVIQSAGLSRNGKNISCLTDLRNESEHNLYSDDSYVFFDKYPSVNIFMEEIACRIVMELAGIIDKRVLR